MGEEPLGDHAPGVAQRRLLEADVALGRGKAPHRALLVEQARRRGGDLGEVAGGGGEIGAGAAGRMRRGGGTTGEQQDGEDDGGERGNVRCRAMTPTSAPEKRYRTSHYPIG